MKVSTLIEIVSASYLTAYVKSNFEDRGGLMLVGPPACLKTTIAETAEVYQNTIVLSDITIRQASELREDMIAHKITTLVLTDVAKLYQRHGAIAANIEGFIRSITGEGFRKPNWEDSRAFSVPARCMVLGCMTSHLYTQNFGRWINDGFARRFLWAMYRLRDPEMLLDSIAQGKRVILEKSFDAKVPLRKGDIEERITPREREQLRRMIRFQPGKEIGLIVMRKMLAALKWKHGTRKAMLILQDFAPCLSKEGGDLIL